MGEVQSLQQIVLGKLNIHMQKNETEHLYHTQNSTQNLKDLKTRSETVKLLEENRRKHHDTSICNYFLTLIRKAQAAKAKLDK